MVVVQNIKDTNFWKQFTTRLDAWILPLWLFRISKIQTFESNSQHLIIMDESQNVVQNIKDTNFWKQFTTLVKKSRFVSELFRISKIQTFESNSQRNCLIIYNQESCSEYQRYKLLKAIHNDCGKWIFIFFVVQNIKDTNFWKQFTTLMSMLVMINMLFRISKIQTFESNSQRIGLHKLLNFVVQNIKDTNFWKQFTTVDLMLLSKSRLFRISKIQTFESNSQLTD